MREASPLSFLGTRASHEASFLRCTTRRAFTPQAWRDASGKRSCEKGILISTVHPSASTATADSQTASQESSSKLSS